MSGEVVRSSEREKESINDEMMFGEVVVTSGAEHIISRRVIFRADSRAMVEPQRVVATHPGV